MLKQRILTAVILGSIVIAGRTSEQLKQARHA